MHNVHVLVSWDVVYRMYLYMVSLVPRLKITKSLGTRLVHG